MFFLSDAEEVDVLRNEPARRIEVSLNFEKNHRIPPIRIETTRCVKNAAAKYRTETDVKTTRLTLVLLFLTGSGAPQTVTLPAVSSQ